MVSRCIALSLNILLLGGCTTIALPLLAQGDVVVRVDDTSGSHCIDATTEKVTLFVRRVFVEKQSNLFTQDRRAGVLVRADISGVKAATAGTDPQQTDVQVPAVDMVSIKDEPKGRVSLALEYGIASDFLLTQGGTTTKTINIYMNLAKAKSKTSFGSVLDLAGQALNQLPIPPNPYSMAASKVLKFANDAVDTSIKADNADQIAHIGLQFNEGHEPDIAKCKAAGNERTGAIAVLQSTGPHDDEFIPTVDTDAHYCFRYSSDSTFELLSAKRTASGSCPNSSTYRGVSNDYVMFLLSAQAAPTNGRGPVEGATDLVRESRDRCKLQKLTAVACGLSH